KKYKVFNLIEIRETFFNKLTILKKENQYILLSNGFQEWSTQPDYFSIKNIVYFSLAFCKDLKKVGIYGNPEILEEIKKYKVPEIYFFEIDKEKFKFIKEYQLKSGSKNIYFYDNLTRFLKENKIKFDVFIITSSLPMTMRENYFLTEDFFREIKDFTETISIVLPGTYDYLGEILLNLHSSIYKTGKKYFVNELLVFTYPMIIIFSNSELKLKKMLLTDKEFFNESYLNFVTDENKKSKYLEKILNTPSHINTISNQFSLYTSIAFYFSQFSQKTGKILIKFFSFLYKLKDFLPIIFLLIFLILLLPSFSPYSTIIFTNGFSSFTFETIFIYLFQIYFGFIYGFISGIIGIFMAGLSSGSLISILRIHSKKTLFYSEILHFLFYA
ncbi:MAG: hypothetical protein NZ891_08145, partial [bacterium]|nr:hypothetical protein [bacterium]MDW8164690.1 hypothetical protein [Candidatus Omnitrophota bacterium]